MGGREGGRREGREEGGEGGREGSKHSQVFFCDKQCLKLLRCLNKNSRKMSSVPTTDGAADVK